MRRPPPVSSLPALFLLVIGLSVVYLMSSQGLNAPPQFDDPPNLGGLAAVDDTNSALEFVAKGRAGPTGRPLSLASFLIEGPGWPASVPQMRRVNILIHLLNGLLVFYLAFLLGRQALSLDENRVAFGSALIAVLWVNSPLLSSTWLMLVQRMASLSALFVLLGLIVFLKGRALLAEKPRKALWLMSMGIALGTLLATLSKENGVLLPVYALCLETLLPRPSPNAARQHHFRRWKNLFLWIPSLAVITYLLYLVPGSESAHQLRGFTLGERLMSEARILWHYLLQALVPDSRYLGPFQDDYPVSRGLLTPPTTLLALLAWLAAGLLAIHWRRRYPLLAFGLFWYLGGHLIESTVVPLELYFPHRNYLPLIGPIILLVYSALSAPRKYRGLLLIGLFALLLIQGVRNWQNASLWNRPLLSAEIWLREHPASARANQNLAKQYIQAGWPRHAMQLMEKARLQNTSSTSHALQAFNLACSVEQDPAKLQRQIEALPAQLTGGHHEFVIAVAVGTLVNMTEAGECLQILNQTNVLPVINALLDNEQVTKVGPTRANLLLARARLHIAKKQLGPSVRSLKAAFKSDPSPETAVMLAAVLTSAGLLDEADKELDAALKQAPVNPLKRWYWHHVISRYQQQMLDFRNP